MENETAMILMIETDKLSGSQKKAAKKA